MVGVCTCEEGEASQERIMLIYSLFLLHQPLISAVAFVLSTCYTAGNHWQITFSIRCNAKEKAGLCGQDEVGELLAAIHQSPLRNTIVEYITGVRGGECNLTCLVSCVCVSVKHRVQLLSAC